MRFLLFGLTFLFFISSNGFSQTIITGKLLGADGKPMVQSDITRVSNRSKFPRDRIEVYSIDKNGYFSFEVESPNLYRFWFSGAYHKNLELPIYTSESDTIRLNVQLEPYHLKEKFQNVEIGIVKKMTGSEKDFPRYKIFKVEPDSSNTYSINVSTEADTVAYKVFGITKGEQRPHGPAFDRLFPHREHNYYSVLNNESGKSVTISINRSDYPEYTAKKAQYTLQKAPDKTRKFLKAYEDYKQRYAAYKKYHDQQQEKGKQPYEIKYDWDEDLIELYNKAKRTEDHFLEKAYLTFFMEVDFSKHWGVKGHSYDKAFAKETLNKLGPVSPLWSFGNYNLGRLLGKVTETDKVYDDKEQEFRELKDKGEEYNQYVRTFVEEHPDSSLYPERLRLGMSWANRYKQYELFEIYYSTFMELYGNTHGGKVVKERYKPQNNITTDKKIPEFQFKLIDSDETVSSKSLLGTRYLINFWGTWCAPCIEKMDDLHKIYDAFKDQGFKILNISINFRKEHFYDFRSKKYPMPWLNVHLQDWDPEEPPLEDFEVVTIPKTILVDKKGIIQAVNPSRQELVELLQRVARQ